MFRETSSLPQHRIQRAPAEGEGSYAMTDMTASSAPPDTTTADAARSRASGSNTQHRISASLSGEELGVGDPGVMASAAAFDTVLAGVKGQLSVASQPSVAAASSVPNSTREGAIDAHGVTQAVLETFLQAHAGTARYTPSASAGRVTASLNDHVGVLSLSVLNPAGTHGASYHIVEHLKVIKDDVATPAGNQARLFVVGYGGRLVKLADLATAMTPAAAPATTAGATVPAATTSSAAAPAAATTPPALETAFRTRLRQLSEASPLTVRSSRMESTDKIMHVAPYKKPLPKVNKWANSTTAMPQGIGRRDPDTGQYDMYLTYDDVEDHLILFKNDTRPPPIKDNDSHKAVTVEGGVLADVYGVSGVELMGPLGEQPGVKGGKWTPAAFFASDPEAGAARRDITLRLTTNDQAVHELSYGDTGIRMRLLYPGDVIGHAPAAGAVGHGPKLTPNEPTVDVYSYDGNFKGASVSRTGAPDPQLILTTTGDRLPAGPFLQGPPGSPAGASVESLLGRALDMGPEHPRLQAVAEGFSEFAGAATELVVGNAQTLAKVTFDLGMGTPVISGRDGAATQALNTALRASMTAAFVVGFSTIIAKLPRNEEGGVLGASHEFSAAGSGGTSMGTLFGAIATMVVAQQILTALFAAMKPLLPNQVNDRATKARVLLNDVVLPALPELTRLAANLVVQKCIFKFHRGSGVDVATLIATALSNAGLDNFVAKRIGDPLNHPVAETLRVTTRFIVETVARSLGNVHNAPEYKVENQGRDMLGALGVRAITRVADKAARPIAANLIDAAGLSGPHASAYNPQIGQEGGGMFNLTDSVVSGVDHIVGGIDDLLEAISKHAGLQRAAFGVNDGLGAADRWSNRLPLTAPPVEDGQVDLQATRTAVDMSRETDAATLATHVAALAAEFETAASAAEQNQDGAIGSHRNQLPARAIEGMNTLDREIAISRTDIGRPDYSPFPAPLGPDGTRRPANYTRSRRFGLSDTPRLDKSLTTWSDDAQAGALRIHNAMREGPGLSDIVIPGEQSASTKSKLKATIIEEAVGYTEESRYRHYPLRWGVTGQDRYQPLVKGIALPYKVMFKPGNTSGPDKWHRTGGKDYFDPIGAVYINLGAALARKYPANLHRAVDTETVYLTGQPGEAQLEKAHMKNGDLAALTEIFSATAAPILAASFGQALGLGATQKERSQRLFIHQETALNVTKQSDLVQAEAITLPGAVYTVRHIDAKPPTGGAPGISQVVYLESLDTAVLEQRHIDWAEAKDKGASLAAFENQRMIDPASGHFYTYVRGELQFDENATKNYFLGKTLEVTPQGGRAATERARWRHPYTSDFAPRNIKDAIHFAILRDDPIVPHLDMATQNVSHEHFRQKNGYYDTDAGKQERAARETLRRDAGVIAAAFPATATAVLPSDSRGKVGELYAWTAASVLRKPLHLVPVSADGAVDFDNKTVIDRTYDKVDLSGEPPVRIGVGADGFYSLRHENGSWRAIRMRGRAGDGFTAANLLHVINRDSFASSSAYSETAAQGLRPSRDASSTVSQLAIKLKSFAGTSSYEVWQRALVEKSRSLSVPAAT